MISLNNEYYLSTEEKKKKDTVIATKEKTLSGKFDNSSSLSQTCIVEVIDSDKLSSAQNMKRIQIHRGACASTHTGMCTCA